MCGDLLHLGGTNRGSLHGDGAENRSESGLHGHDIDRGAPIDVVSRETALIAVINRLCVSQALNHNVTLTVFCHSLPRHQGSSAPGGMSGTAVGDTRNRGRGQQEMTP